MRPTLLALTLAFAAPLFAQGTEGLQEAQGLPDDLGEAQGLPETGDKPPTPPKEEELSAWRVRGYAVLEHQTRKVAAKDRPSVFFPNVDANLALSGPLAGSTEAFFDGRALYLDQDEETLGILSQAGVRIRPHERIALALGKERNRRSPGLIVSPSDFLHSSENLPGMRRETAGVWLIRVSYQDIEQSLDLMWLPVDRQRDSGLPADDAKPAGGAVRYFRRLKLLDLSAALGRIDEVDHAGAYVQGLAFDVWKLYLEWGRADEDDRWLAGLGYEGSDDFTLRVELYRNEAGATEEEWERLRALTARQGNFGTTSGPSLTAQGLSALPRRDYAIASVSLVEIANRFNVTETLIKSLEDRTFANMARLHWLLSDRHVVGTSLLHLDPSERSQFLQRPFDWQLTLDWQVSL